jgi:hypothetical protein
MELHHYNAAPALGKNFDTTPAPLNTKPTFLNEEKINIRAREIFNPNLF